MKKSLTRFFTSLLFFIISFKSFSAAVTSEPGISIVSYILRDRAVIIDSLELRKTLYLEFATSHSLKEVKGCAVAGALIHDGGTVSKDTTWLFDEAKGNLGFNLPYNIPEGTYRVNIRIVSKSGNIIDSLSSDYDRSDLKPYFNRETQYWDNTTPFAHLECSGYGHITYHFNSDNSSGLLKKITLSARMTSDNEYPAQAELRLNGVSIGKLILPAGEKGEPVVTWSAEGGDIPEEVMIRNGENQLSFFVNPDSAFKGTGLRIFARKNSVDPAVGPEMPVALSVTGQSSEQNFRIPVWGEDGEHIDSRFTIPYPKSFRQVIIPEKTGDVNVTAADVARGFVVFERSFMSYIYPWTVPDQKERKDTISHVMARNDFDPVTFALYPLSDLGDVKISLSDLKGTDGKVILSENILLRTVKNMKIRTGDGTDFYLIPRLIDQASTTNIPLSYSTRFWLTFHADNTVTTGRYTGMIIISSEKKGVSQLPLIVDIVPVTLEPVPGKDYAMLMSYEFFELDNKEWSAAQKVKIYSDGVNSFRDYLNHGMSTVVVSSPYYFQWNKNRTPQIDHLKAMIRATVETGITNPVCWYYGHYLQAAKGQHPGNMRIYDSGVHPARAKYLTELALQLDSDLHGKSLYFMPIDEPRTLARQKMTIDLLKEIKKVPGAKTMCTTNIGDKLLDIEIDSQVDRVLLKPGEKIRHSTRKVWEYNNDAVQAFNPGYSRYIYGYYTWRQDLDGMTSWGPGTTENSRGNPYEDLDHEFTDYAITYPHQGGPLATPNWEAVREGIDDIRYIYQLEKRCSRLSSTHPAEVKEAQAFLDSIRTMCDFDDRKILDKYGDWTPERFEKLRLEVIDWILKLDSL